MDEMKTVVDARPAFVEWVVEPGPERPPADLEA